MTITSPKRIGALALVAAIAVAACSSGSSPTPAATAAASEAPSASAMASEAPSASAAASPSAAAVTPPAVPTGNVSLTGAGATFPAPLYQVWFEKYQALYPNIKIDYTANGSGAGIKAITDQTVDFGASDAAMKDSEIAALKPGTTILHVPTALGAVVLIYNVPGVTDLKLDGPTTAGIYLGKITDLERPGDRCPQSRARPSRAATSSWSIAPTDPARRTRSRATSPRSAPTGRAGPALARTSSGRPASARKGNDGVAGNGQADPGFDRLRGAPVRHPGEPLVGLAEERRRQLRPGLGRRRHRRRRGRGVDLPGRLPPGADHQRRRRRRPTRSPPTPTSWPTWTRRTRPRGRPSWHSCTGPSPTARPQEKALGYAPLPAPVQQAAIDNLHTFTYGGAPIWAK